MDADVFVIPLHSIQLNNLRVVTPLSSFCSVKLQLLKIALLFSKYHFITYTMFCLLYFTFMSFIE